MSERPAYADPKPGDMAEEALLALSELLEGSADCLYFNYLADLDENERAYFEDSAWIIVRLLRKLRTQNRAAPDPDSIEAYVLYEIGGEA
jgi:hypothetical protein